MCQVGHAYTELRAAATALALGLYLFVCRRDGTGPSDRMALLSTQKKLQVESGM